MNLNLRHIAAVALCVLTCLPAAHAGQRADAPATFIIVRHAERVAGKDAITPAGKTRAEVLRDFMLTQRVKAVYSTDTDRTMGTAAPTAKAIGVGITKYEPLPTPGKEFFTALARKHAGQAVLIVGHSNTVVPFANGFGARSNYKIGEDEYHSMFIVAVNGETTNAVRINYGALPKPAPGRKPVPARQKAGQP